MSDRPRHQDQGAGGDRLLGAVLGGRYTILSRIGGGGMGEVFVARHNRLGCLFALKALRPELREQELALRRFRREAELGATVNHPNLVRIFDYDTEDRVPYLVMELLAGIDLRLMLEAEKTLPPHRALRLIVQALQGLAHAHQLGVIHRDLKPANMFVVDPGPQEYCKIVDFGVATRGAYGPAEHEPLTTGDKPLGTLSYMAPEQQRGAAPDAAADVYSVGAVTFELLSGERYCDVGTLPGHARLLLDRHLRKAGLERTSARAVTEILMRALSPLTRDRFPDAAAISQVLEPVVNRIGPKAPRSLVAHGVPWAQLAVALTSFGVGVTMTRVASLSRREDPTPVRAAMGSWALPRTSATSRRAVESNGWSPAAPADVSFSTPLAAPSASPITATTKTTVQPSQRRLAAPDVASPSKATYDLPSAGPSAVSLEVERRNPYD